MASSTTSTPLSLFPSPASTFPSRASSMTRPRGRQDERSGPKQLQGLTLQVTSPSRPAQQPTVLPVARHIQHSLFCDPITGSAAQATRPVPSSAPGRQGRPRRRASRDSSVAIETSPLSQNQDQFAPRPQHAQSVISSPKRSPSKKQLKRPVVSHHVSTGPSAGSIYPSIEHVQQSPLPEKTCLHQASQSHLEYPATIPSGSISPSSLHQDRPAWPSSSHSTPIRSIFPQFDPSKPVSQQNYYPTRRSLTPTVTTDKFSKMGSPVEQPTLQRFDSGLALVHGYEHIPSADSGDVAAIWKASCGEYPVAGRKVRFGLQQPRGHGTSIAIGRTETDLIYTMATQSPTSTSFSYTADDVAGKQLAIKRYGPDAAAEPVSQIILPTAGSSQGKLNSTSQKTSVFPQMAAIHAIETITSSPAAAQIAAFDPVGTSSAAVRLARDAVAEAHRHHGCELIRSTRNRDSLGAVTANYNLEHPSLGFFPITVTKSFTQNSAVQGARAKICVHHPSATPAALAAETLVLTFLDFARDACVLDLPGLFGLESPYIIDIAITAMLAVAAIENDALMTEAVSFPAPPTMPFKPTDAVGKKDRKGKKAKQSRRSSRIMSKVKDEILGEQVELPMLTQGALSLVGFSLKAALVLVEAGVKLTAGVVIGTTRLVRKM